MSSATAYDVASVRLPVILNCNILGLCLMKSCVCAIYTMSSPFLSMDKRIYACPKGFPPIDLFKMASLYHGEESDLQIHPARTLADGLEVI